MPKRLCVKIYGRVQGVGFRSYLYKVCQSLDVRGWVKNCRGGYLELEIEAEAKVLEKVLESAQRGPWFARVDRLEVKEEDFIGYRDFCIKNSKL